MKEEEFSRKELKLRENLEKDPADVENYSLLGKLYFLAGRYEEAAKVYLDGLKAVPDSQVLLLNLGVIREAQDHPEEAIRGPQPRSARRSLKHGELLPEGEVLSDHVTAAAEG